MECGILATTTARSTLRMWQVGLQYPLSRINIPLLVLSLYYAHEAMDPCPGGKHVFQRVFMDHALKKMAALSGRWPVLGCRDGATVWRGGVDAAPCCQTGDQPRLPIDMPGEPEHAGGAGAPRAKRVCVSPSPCG